MSDQRLPSTVVTQQLASKNAELSGTIAVAKLPRLAAAVTSSNGEVSVCLRFALDDQKRQRVAADVSCELQVLCQRCLKPMPLAVESSVEAVLVADDEAAQQVPRHLDPVVTQAGILDTNEFIEDELLLCLPFTSYHEYNCIGTVEGDAASSPAEQHKPFADLASIMNKR